MRTAIPAAAALLIVAILENTFFGQDHPGTAHDISVAFFILAILSFLALIGLLALAATRQLRRRRPKNA